jgi:hypothetical protein
LVVLTVRAGPPPVAGGGPTVVIDGEEHALALDEHARHALCSASCWRTVFSISIKYGVKDTSTMWRSVPSLVALRDQLSAFLAATLEPGGDNDYVTVEFLVDRFRRLHPDDFRNHHINQIVDGVTDLMRDGGSEGKGGWDGGGKWVAAVKFPGVATDGDGDGDDDDPDADICFSCGKCWKRGYRNAFRFVKLRDRGLSCPYNYGCGCRDELGFLF